jgi:3-dehydroquinate synthase
LLGWAVEESKTVGDTAQNVEVNLGERSYRIDIGTEVLGEIGARLRQYAPLTHAVVITDENVETYGRQAQHSIEQLEVRTDLCCVPPGEPSKSVAEAQRLWQWLLAVGTDRQSVVLAVGGGVVGDLAGFVAATYARGLRFCQVPTSLLAQVDSSVGGKVGINLPLAKNMVGAFWQPTYVLIDTQVMQTLPGREYRSGLAEVVKYGVILDAAFFDFLEQQVPALRARQADVLRTVVARCCRLKADVVEADECERTGQRAVLNFGHTFAHALESVTGYGQWLHGEAVAIGMVCAARLAERLGRTDQALTDRLRRLLQALELPCCLPDADETRLVQAMRSDKKVEHGRLRFVLPSRMGHVELVPDLDPDLILDVLAASR